MSLIKAEAIIREAGTLAMEYFNNRSRLVVDQKGLQDYVSEADQSVEQFLRHRLRDAFPDDGFLGEELGLD